MMESHARRLRELTDTHYHGLMEWQDYRAARGALLDSLLTAPDAELESGENLSTLRQPGRGRSEPGTSEPSGPRPVDDAAAAPSPVATSASSASPAADSGLRRRLLWAGGGGGGLLVALFVWLVMPGGESPPVPAGEREVTGVESAPVGSVIEAFLERGSWDEEAVSRLLFEWDGLDVEQRGELRRSESFRRFVAEVRRRIMVDRAVGAPDFRNGLSLSEALAVELELGLVAERIAEPDEERARQAQEGAAADTGLQQPVAANEPAMDDASIDAGALPSGSAEASPGEVSAAAADARVPADRSVTAAEPAAASSAPAAVPESQQPAAAAADEAEPAGQGHADAAATGPRLESEQPCTVERLKYRSATCWDLLAEQVRAPVLRVVPAGTFVMGDPDDESASPVREVRIERPFAIGMFEVSHGEFERFCRDTGRPCPEPRWASSEHPVVGVTWSDAQAYVDWLSAATGASYRLPTEAEWEYAARAGESSRYPFGDEIAPAFARYDSGMGNGGALPSDDRTTRRNGYRLLHMAGNVRELTADAWRQNYSAPVESESVAVRGGSYADPADRLRCAAREAIARTHADAQTGFRIVRDLP